MTHTISRRDWMKLTGAGATGVLCSEWLKRTALAAPPERKPNIIYIMADDLGYGDLGCYGQKHILTPRLDRMAAGGMRFTDFYSPAPVCAPARRSLLTGLHGGHATRRANNPRAEMKPEEITVAEVLKQAGYATGVVGKWSEGVGGSTGAPRRQGFDYFFGIEQERGHGYHHWFLRKNGEKVYYKDNPRTKALHCTNAYTDEAIGFIKRNSDKPFFLYLPYQAPHFHFSVPEEDMKPYADKSWDTLPEGANPHRFKKNKRVFAALVTMLDRSVGRILDTLKELDIDDNTIVMFTSDNGPAFQADIQFFRSTGRFRGIKRSLNEGGIRVPMIARWPGKIKAGAVCNTPFAGYDFMTTAADIAGTTPPEHTDGISFLPTLVGKAQTPHEYLYWESHENDKIQAVRMGKWKFIRSMRLEKWGPCLFDLEKDPREKKNLAKSNPDIVKEMLSIMDREHQPSPVKQWQLPAGWLKRDEGS